MLKTRLSWGIVSVLLKLHGYVFEMVVVGCRN